MGAGEADRGTPGAEEPWDAVANVDLTLAETCCKVMEYRGEAPVTEGKRGSVVAVEQGWVVFIPTLTHTAWAPYKTTSR